MGLLGSVAGGPAPGLWLVGCAVGGCLDDGEGEGLEFAEQGPELFGVVKQRLVVG